MGDMKMPSIVFFDAAGTLIRLARPVGETYARLAVNYGAVMSVEATERRFRQAWREMNVGAGSPPRLTKGWWKEVVRKSLPEEGRVGTFPFDDYFEELFRVFARPDLWRVFPEVEGVLDKLEHCGVRRAVLSNWDGRLRGILDGLGLARRFEWIGVSEELGAAKPDQRIFRAAESAVGLRGREVWLVGDDAAADWGGAEMAGWTGRLLMRPDRNLEVALAEVWSEADL